MESNRIQISKTEKQNNSVIGKPVSITNEVGESFEKKANQSLQKAIKIMEE